MNASHFGLLCVRRLVAASVLFLPLLLLPMDTALAADKPAGTVLKTDFGDVQVFPPDNPWNMDVSKLPVHPNSAQYIASIGADKPLHPDFGTVWQGAPNGIPYCVVRGDQKKVPVEFEYADESDPGRYPVPPDAPIEGGPTSKGDRHILVIDFTNRKLYELFAAYPKGGGWKAGSGAVFDLASNTLRPDGWTSADAAGLPIFPGLARHEEVESGKVTHALRFTVRRTCRAYLWPARHFASQSNDKNLPPMGLRVRLKASYDTSKLPRTARVIADGLKTYGMMLADNGGDWFISGCPNAKWDDEEIAALKRIRGRELEAVLVPPPKEK